MFFYTPKSHLKSHETILICVYESLTPFRRQKGYTMATIYGYARCSTNEDLQDIDRQKRELKKMGVENAKYIYWEYESGMRKDRAELQKLLDIVKPGDTIITTEVSRLTRSTSHLCEILEVIQDKKLCLIIDSFKADCRKDEIDPMTKGMLMMWGCLRKWKGILFLKGLNQVCKMQKVRK